MRQSKIFACNPCPVGPGIAQSESIQNISVNSNIYSDGSNVMVLNFGGGVATSSINLPSDPSNGDLWSLNSLYPVALLSLVSTYPIQGYTGAFYFSGTPPLKYIFDATLSKWLIK